jgi:DMSO/TMAO reductase YedYZ molybdopterin-dependent catalytic subunit
MNQSRGFVGRRGGANVTLPPGQYLTRDFPVLSATPAPQVSLDRWELTIDDGKDVLRRWNWKSFRELPSEHITVDIHCVTRWSKLGTAWEGVSLDTLLEDLVDDASFVLARSYGGYTTNVPLEDLIDGRAWIAFRFDGEDLEPEHGGPARLLVPHLYFWKSAKWVKGITLLNHDEPGFWETRGYHFYLTETPIDCSERT